MGRKSDVWYWRYAKGFYTTIKGQRQFLAGGLDDEKEKGPVYRAACVKFAELINLANADVLGDTNTVKTVCERFLEWVKANRSPGTYKIRRVNLTSLVHAIGSTPILSLQPRFLAEYFEQTSHQPKESGKPGRVYAPNTRRFMIDSLQAALNWAAGEGKLISKNPLAGMASIDPESRGLEVLITPEQHQLALARFSGWRRDFLVCLEATGCRPGELRAAKAIHWRAELGAIVFPGKGRNRRGDHQHKTSYTGKDRVIFFTGEAKEIMVRLVKERTVGNLFLGRCNKPVKQRTVNNIFQRLQLELDLPFFIPTSYRHLFATRALRLGWTVDLVATLLGNSPAVIRRHYGHLADDPRAMMLAMVRLRQQMAEGEESP